MQANNEMTTELLNIGFEQKFPFVPFFYKDDIQVKTDYRPTKNDVIEDTSGHCMFCNKITVFDLPNAKSYCFKSDENALKFIKCKLIS
jgi:hypothetical protein